MSKISNELDSFDGTALLRTVGCSAGVYLMEDSLGNCLYVGKAKNLRKRLANYFRKSELHGKTKLLVSQIAKVETINTHTEGEALLLENSLIKKNKPRYNVIFRDDKSYPYIRITVDQPYPGISFYRGSLNRPGLYFGPYASVAAVREILTQIQKLIPVRHCSDSYFSNRSRPCLQHQIRRCSAPCMDLINRSVYAEDIKQVILLLEGRNKLLAELFQNNMETAAKSLNYEVAGSYRDRISALREIEARQGALLPRDRDIDFITVVERAGVIIVCVMFIRFGQNHGNRHYIFRPRLGEDASYVLASFLPQFYLGNVVPREIIVHPPYNFDKSLTEFLSEQSGHVVTIKKNVRGRRAQVLLINRAQAEDHLDRYLTSKESYENRFKSLCQELNVDTDMCRIEGYDISHTGGEAVVASQVVFRSSGPDRSQYRYFNIKEANPGDDYGALREVLMRRFRNSTKDRSLGTIPNILVVDGGKGQLRIAYEVISDLGVQDVCLVGIAKGLGRKPNLDRMYAYKANVMTNLVLSKTTTHLVQEIRDEAHRFAITGHRRQSTKSRRRSTLEDIDGVGAKRRQLLLTHFGGLRSIEKAGIDEISRVRGISLRLAKNIYQHFHS